MDAKGSYKAGAYLGVYDNGNQILGDSRFTYADGRTGDIAEANLLFGNTQPLNSFYVSNNAYALHLANGDTEEIITGSNLNVDAGASGVKQVVSGGKAMNVRYGLKRAKKIRNVVEKTVAKLRKRKTSCNELLFNGAGIAGASQIPSRH